MDASWHSDDMSRSAQIYLGEDRIRLQPLGFLNCVWCGGAPVHRLPHSASVAEILAELVPALAEGRQPSLPIDLDALGKPMLAATGEKMLAAISRAFACIDVEETETELSFHPQTPAYRGFSGTGKYQRCDKADQKAMAAAFRAAAAIAMEEQHLLNPPPLP